LCSAASETVVDLMAEAVCQKQGFRPGMSSLCGGSEWEIGEEPPQVVRESACGLLLSLAPELLLEEEPFPVRALRPGAEDFAKIGDPLFWRAWHPEEDNRART